MKAIVSTVVALFSVLGTASSSGAGRRDQVFPRSLESANAKPMPDVYYETYAYNPQNKRRPRNPEKWVFLMSAETALKQMNCNEVAKNWEFEASLLF